MRGPAASLLAALGAALLLASASSETGHGAALRQAESLPPNVVLVMTDDQRWDTLWAMPTVRDALAGQGVTFSNGFVVNGLCCPSRASVLTGRYSHSTGVYLNQFPNGGFRSFDDSSTIATMLHGAGYSTALIGKYLNGYGSNGDGEGYVPPGWDVWEAFYGGMGYYDYRLSEQGRVVRYHDAPRDYSTDVLRRKAVTFLRGAREPFLLAFTPYGPHGPAKPPPRYEHTFDNISWWKPPSFNEQDLSDKPAHIRHKGLLTKAELRFVNVYRRRQLAASLAVDDAVREILGTLEHRRVLTRTFIVFMSDNGVAWGEHALNAGKKAVPYEEPIRIPLVIRYDPLTKSHPAKEGRLALNIDLAPTFAELAGTEAKHAEGRSLLPLLRGDPQPAWRNDFLIEHLQGLPYREVPTYCAVRGERYKYVLYQTGEEELYDLALDPHELSNRASWPSLLDMKAILRARLAEICRPPPPGYTALQAPRARP
jgi:N-acetylglucosamine-6-sulfatase